MVRNREIRYMILVMGFISSLGMLIGGLLFSLEVAAFVFIISTLFISSVMFLMRWRYREIEKLSHYLHHITNGGESLDIRDNDEGELSILKNDIYKVTLMLSEQSTLLQEEKIQLTDAISDISHQLKTPLTSMVVMADLLNDPALPDDKRAEFVRNIQMQLERIEWLVSSLLKLSKIDAGTAQFNKKEVKIKQLIEKALEPILIPIDIKEQTISIIGNGDTTITCDLNWTTEAILNILKNCVEHTAEGGKIKIYYVENVLFTEVIIVDSGKGIPKEDLPYVFKRFYKGKYASDDSVGIGLAMAYSIISHQEADMEVESTEGKGTKFRIKFYKK